MEGFVLHWGNRAAEGELDSNGGLLEYKVRMPSTRLMRQETNLTVVSIEELERNGGGKRSGRVGDRKCQSGLGRGHFVSAVTKVRFSVVSSGYLTRNWGHQTNGSNIDLLPIHPIPTSVFHSISSPLFPTDTAAQLSARPSLLPPSTSPSDVLVSFSPCGSIRNCSRGAC
jgi:hypothetical protein